MTLRSRNMERSVAEPIPEAARRLAAKLQRMPGVVCVVWGSRRKSGRWQHHQKCLSVHVASKLDPRKLRPSQRLPKEIDGIRIDVLEVGRPKLQRLSVEGRIDAGALGRSTITALAKRGANTLALLSGHGAKNAGEVTVDLGNHELTGRVTQGRFGGGSSVDYALAVFDDAANLTNTHHPAAEGRAPLELMSGLSGGERVVQFSTGREKLSFGIFQGSVAGEVSIGGELYSELLSIAPATSAAFSEDGDSGSLVLEQDTRHAVGAVVGRGDSSVFYAYDVSRLAALLPGATFDQFFKE